MKSLLNTLAILGFTLGLIAAIRIGWAIGTLFELLSVLPRVALHRLLGRDWQHGHGHDYGSGGSGGRF